MASPSLRHAASGVSSHLPAVDRRAEAPPPSGTRFGTAAAGPALPPSPRVLLGPFSDPSPPGSAAEARPQDRRWAPRRRPLRGGARRPPRRRDHPRSAEMREITRDCARLGALRLGEGPVWPRRRAPAASPEEEGRAGAGGCRRADARWRPQRRRGACPGRGRVGRPPALAVYSRRRRRLFSPGGLSERRPTLSEAVRDCTGRRLAPPLLERVCGRAAGAASPRDGQLRHRQVVDAARRRGAAGQAAENGASFHRSPRCTGAPSRGCGTAARATSLARTPPTRCSCRSGRTARSARCGSSWCTRGQSTSGEL